MNHFTFTQQFREIYDRALALYTEGRRGAESYFTPEELAFLTANGITAQHVYDYVEDLHDEGGPDYDTALSIEIIRRDYFLNVQNGQWTGKKDDPATWPTKDESIWLPRLLAKARAKLHGELPDSGMFCCAGDRRFLAKNNIHPSEFMNLVWRAGDDDQAIIDFVAARSKTLSA
ncbi:hypothetical protein AXK12_01760 [Cephaloticoccus capnophilus]|uniref:DUF5069 domain-containing protein n=1 Tax=Cephaloticoccus capnophilus TaxID=1548208 RepID=A0A139SSA5_9BACT|nr:DUF5069 domain-containing protein [Cephaloticoccus capnophilus]KXU37427.1 hypothetical protein AXK12_01760 [Cephaloticoccus capnophilus]